MVSSMNCNCWASQHSPGHRRVSSRNDWSQPRSRAVPCSVDMCVEDETVDSSGASALRNLVSFSTWCTSLRVCVTPLSCTPASSSSARFVGVACCWHCSSCLQLAVLFHPLWVRSFPPWLLFSPAVGPLFSVLLTRCGSTLFLSLFRSPFASFWTSIMHRVILDLSLCRMEHEVWK